MIIVNPDEVFLGVDHFDHFLGKDFVSRDVTFPHGSVESAGSVLQRKREHVMKKGPEMLLAETPVELAQGVGEESNDAPEFF